MVSVTPAANLGDESFKMHDSPGRNVSNANNLAAEGSSIDPLSIANASLALPFGGKPSLLEDASVDTIFNFKSCNVFSVSLTDQVAGVVNQNFTQEAKGDQIGLNEVSGVKSYSPGQLVADLKNADIKGTTGPASQGTPDH